MMITETLLLLKFAMYKSPLFRLKAMPFGPEPTCMMATLSSREVLVYYIVGSRKRKFILRGPLFSASSKENKTRCLWLLRYCICLPSDNQQWKRQNCTPRVCLCWRRLMGGGCCYVQLFVAMVLLMQQALLLLNVFARVIDAWNLVFYPLSVRLPLLACNRVWSYWWHHCIVCN